MSDLDLTALKRRGLSVLRLSAADWHELRETRGRGAKFTSIFRHGTARAGNVRAPVLIVIEGGMVGGRLFERTDKVKPELKLAWIKSIQAVATLESRVSFDHVLPVAPATLDALIGDNVPSRFRASAESLLRSRGTFEEVSPKYGEWPLDRLAAREENDRVFGRMTALVAPPRQFRNGVALEQDALALALKAFGAPTAEATTLALGQRSTALAGARLREDVVIEHDARWIPGWTLDSSDVTGRAVFTQGREELQVFTANKQPLEQLFGVDLIYLNETRRSIVMVQYKMMEPLERTKRQIGTGLDTIMQADEAEWVVPIDDQFRDEMARMAQFDQPAGPVGSYRMSPNPFFFKLVRRYGSTGGAGILLSLSHLQQLLGEGQLTGPRGGLRIAYSELNGHYLRGETFVDLIRSGYIGSQSATTDHLETLIKATLAEGRGVVAAIQRVLPDPRLPTLLVHPQRQR
jgi:hypothetical protein